MSPIEPFSFGNLLRMCGTALLSLDFGGGIGADAKPNSSLTAGSFIILNAELFLGMFIMSELPSDGGTSVLGGIMTLVIGGSSSSASMPNQLI
jgi:hypothetical protein